MKVQIATNPMQGICVVESVRHRQNVDVQTKFKKVCSDQILDTQSYDKQTKFNRIKSKFRLVFIDIRT